MKTKLVCVMRRDLRNAGGNKISKGKLIALAGHAYVAAVLQAQKGNEKQQDLLNIWLNKDFFKIGLGADTKEELEELYEKALQAGLNVVRIEDQGHTEFKEKTFTCIAIGPDFEDRINLITGHLKGL